MSSRIIKKSIQVNEYVADTMALIFRLENRKMPQKVREKFIQAESAQCQILIPAIVFAELGDLAEKDRIDTSLKKTKTNLDHHSEIKQLTLDYSGIREAFEIDDIPELHDRLIAATAKQLSIPILTNGPVIQSSKYIETIWN